MLDDKPRKLLTILFHFTRERGRPQTIDELVRRLKWTRKQVIDALQVLSDKGFILWDPDRHTELKIIKPFDLDFQPESKPKPFWEYD